MVFAGAFDMTCFNKYDLHLQFLTEMLTVYLSIFEIITKAYSLVNGV